MANQAEESDPLLKPNPSDGRDLGDAPAKKTDTGANGPTDWTADGVPLGLGHGGGVREPAVARSQWSSGLFACLGRNDEFCSSDLEVCLLGSFAPCVLYGSNVERLESDPEKFVDSCLQYTCFCMLGNFLFGWNCMTPSFSYISRASLRRKFNLEGSCEALARSCGCCSSIVDHHRRREYTELACDLATHFFCHQCSLCQEARELRRRLPHPGFNVQPLVVVMPPTEQRMGRGNI